MKKEAKKQKKGLIILTVIFGLIALLLFLTYSSNTHLTKSRYEVKSSELPSEFDGFKIVQLSDLHTKSFGENYQRLLKTIEKENPDIVVMTGDMVSSTDTPSEFSTELVLMTELASKYNTYYVDGNHETSMNYINSDYYDEWNREIKNAGVVVLDNYSVDITKGNASFEMYGLWYNGRYYNDMSKTTSEKYYLDEDHIDDILGRAEKDKFNLLLTHNPVYFDVYSEWGADLTLAGHMHGGVIRIPFKGGLISPEKVYWPKYDAGEFSIGDSVMIVNRGLGNGTSGYRFMNWPDVSVITLKSS